LERERNTAKICKDIFEGAVLTWRGGGEKGNDGMNNR
jgi:hypothetical protein